MRTLRMIVAAAGLLIGFASCDKNEDTAANSSPATGASASGDGIYTTNMVGRYTIERFERNNNTSNAFSSMKLDLGREGNINLLMDTSMAKGTWVYDPETRLMDLSIKGNNNYSKALSSKQWLVKLSDGQYLEMEAPDSIGVKKITLRKRSSGTLAPGQGTGMD